MTNDVGMEGVVGCHELVPFGETGSWFSQSPLLLQSQSSSRPENFNKVAQTSRCQRPVLALIAGTDYNSRTMSHWTNKVIAVTGGSAGLGLAIARRFAARGAKIALIARHPGRLEEAARSLDAVDIATATGDLAVADQAAAAIDKVIGHFGRLDALINNVGRSVRTELFSTTLDDYRSFMDINLHAAVNCTNAAIDALVATSGHVVNIGSLSCKTAWPFLAPYTTSKFAMAGWNHHLRLEGPGNVHYMLVCPGPIKRDDAGSRYDEQARGLPESARRPAAGARVHGVTPERLADQIIDGCQKRKLEIMPWRTRLAYTALAFSPRFGDWLLRRKMRKANLTPSAQDRGTEVAPVDDSETRETTDG